MAKRTAIAAEPAERPPTRIMAMRKVPSNWAGFPPGSFSAGRAGGWILGRESLNPFLALPFDAFLLPLISLP
ncbi:hypothetical protein D3C86_1535160 [compost metagenome]